MTGQTPGVVTTLDISTTAATSGDVTQGPTASTLTPGDVNLDITSGSSPGDVTTSSDGVTITAQTTGISSGTSEGVTQASPSSRGPIEGCYTPTLGGTGGGSPCVFPFTYSGQTYEACTTVDRGAPWCSVTSDFPTDGLFGFCQGKVPFVSWWRHELQTLFVLLTLCEGTIPVTSGFASQRANNTGLDVF